MPLPSIGGRKTHLVVLGLDVGALVEELVDEVELAEPRRPVEGGHVILRLGRDAMAAG
jgi:hypothetical protein